MTRTHGIANAQQAAYVWRTLPVPVIAAIHGVAFGGGFQIALGADMRYVAPDARLSILEIKWGLVPDMSGIALMRELARSDVIRELAMTGRVFSGTEALAYGFATSLHADPLAAARATAKEIAARSPDAVRAVKRLLNQASDADAAAILLAEFEGAGGAHRLAEPDRGGAGGRGGKAGAVCGWRVTSGVHIAAVRTPSPLTRSKTSPRLCSETPRDGPGGYDPYRNARDSRRAHPARS